MKKLLLFSLLILFSSLTYAQPRVLVSGVTLDPLLTVKAKADRVDRSPVTGNLAYINSIGELYVVKKNSSGTYYDSLVASSAQHGIQFLQGMCFKGDTLFLIGNQLPDTVQYFGVVMRCTNFSTNPSAWEVVAKTEMYPQGKTWYDHGFSGIVLDPAGDYLYLSSGSRSDHGEEQNNGGLYPGYREVPLTSAIFRIPSNASNLVLPASAGALAPYMFADGTRNTFDMAFLPNGDLIGIDNSGDRDDPDELNWLRSGGHYGFPWMLGSDPNPQRSASYDPEKDLLLNHKCNAYLKKYYHNDPSYPLPPAGVNFLSPIVNAGPDADKFRDSLTGKVKDASDLGISFTTFTPHRSPLGLTVDKAGVLDGSFKGKTFMLSYTTGGDSSGLHNGGPGTILDPGQDLIMLNLNKNGNNYSFTTTKIVDQFKNPVDACLFQNEMYVIEYGYATGGKIYKLTFPKSSAVKELGHPGLRFSLYPNPVHHLFSVELNRSRGEKHFEVYNSAGVCVLRDVVPSGMGKFAVDMQSYRAGLYLVRVIADREVWQEKFMLAGD